MRHWQQLRPGVYAKANHIGKHKVWSAAHCNGKVESLEKQSTSIYRPLGGKCSLRPKPRMLPIELYQEAQAAICVVLPHQRTSRDDGKKAPRSFDLS